MSTRRAVLAAAPGLLAALSGCGSAPTNYYRLAALPGAALPGGPPAVVVRGVSIPGYLDQANIARPSGAYQLDTYPSDLWAEPLADMLQATMAQDLAARLPRSTVLGSGGAIAAPADAAVEINVLHFEPDAAGRIALQAQIAIRGGADHALWQALTFSRAAVAGPAVADMVAVMSTLWAAAADQAAAMIAAGWTGRRNP